MDAEAKPEMEVYITIVKADGSVVEIGRVDQPKPQGILSRIIRRRDS